MEKRKSQEIFLPAKIFPKGLDRRSSSVLFWKFPDGRRKSRWASRPKVPEGCSFDL
jgi:hypothetical protein